MDLTSLYICLRSLIVSSPFFLTNTTQYPHEREWTSASKSSTLFISETSVTSFRDPLYTHILLLVSSLIIAFLLLQALTLPFFFFLDSPRFLFFLEVLLRLPFRSSHFHFTSFYFMIVFLSLFFSCVRFWFLVVACSVTLVFLFRSTQNHLDLHSRHELLNLFIVPRREFKIHDDKEKSSKEGFRFHFPLESLSCVRHPLSCDDLCCRRKKDVRTCSFKLITSTKTKWENWNNILISIYSHEHFHQKKFCRLSVRVYRSHVYMRTALFLQEMNERMTVGVRRVGRQLIWISFILVSCLFYFYPVLSSHCHWISFDIIFRAPRLPCIWQNDTKTFHTQETFFF